MYTRAVHVSAEDAPIDIVNVDTSKRARFQTVHVSAQQISSADHWASKTYDKFVDFRVPCTLYHTSFLSSIVEVYASSPLNERKSARNSHACLWRCAICLTLVRFMIPSRLSKSAQNSERAQPASIFFDRQLAYPLNLRRANRTTASTPTSASASIGVPSVYCRLATLSYPPTQSQKGT